MMKNLLLKITLSYLFFCPSIAARSAGIVAQPPALRTPAGGCGLCTHPGGGGLGAAHILANII